MERTATASSVGAAVIGLGVTGTETVREVLESQHRLLAGVTTTTAKLGADLGELTIGERLGIPVIDLDTLVAMPEVQSVVYAGLDTPTMLQVFERCADVGQDVITVTGMFHPQTALGDAGAAALDARAKAGGARILGTGLSPGLWFDALPALLAGGFPGPSRVWTRRACDIAGWSSTDVAEVVNLAGSADDGAGGLRTNLVQGAHLLAEAIGHDLEEVTESTSAIVAQVARAGGEWRFGPGDPIGFHHRVAGRAGTTTIESEWVGVVGLDEELDGMQEGASVMLDGPKPVRAELSGSGMLGAYRPTAARAVKSISPLRTLPPGLRRVYELPLSVARGVSG
jgi:4-hydroxy-tetrahydrodipicolinate reductase